MYIKLYAHMLRANNMCKLNYWVELGDDLSMTTWLQILMYVVS